uniref:Uncharacterized protein n=1 Tax=Arundo donax TaxID=35708 RepID=A0A0A9F227_ARUDO
MTNNVLVGLVFASGLLPSRLAARSPCHRKQYTNKKGSPLK